MAARTTRRAPGMGHLFVKRDKAGREIWYAKWYSHGRQVKRRIGERRPPGGARGMIRPEAEKAMRKMIETTTPAASERADVRTAGERLIAHLEALGRKPATTEQYGSLLRVHLAPFFGGRSLDAIGVDDVEAFVRAKSAEGKSPKTIRNALGFLYSVFEFGKRRGWARANPCEGVEQPESPEHSDVRFLDPDELDAVVRAGREVGDELAPTLALVFLAAGMTGLRQGELIGLRWGDVDWTAGKVRVRQSYVRGEFTTPKSRRGSRSVPLADELAGELERHYQASVHQADDDLVFAHPLVGSPLDRSKVRKRFKSALRAAGVREVRFHDLRHTFGTRMAGVGVPMRTLQEWMGHRDIQTTQIYADYSPSEREREWVEVAFARGTTPGTKPSETERTEVT
ncbi:MAG: site-specific integrase [Actinomycetota bacterium]